MKMRPVSDGLEIPAGGSAILEAGGYHLMFKMLKENMKVGQKRIVTLEFENTGAVQVEMHVVSPAELKNNNHSSHGSQTQ